MITSRDPSPVRIVLKVWSPKHCGEPRYRMNTTMISWGLIQTYRTPSYPTPPEPELTLPVHTGNFHLPAPETPRLLCAHRASLESWEGKAGDARALGTVGSIRVLTSTVLGSVLCHRPEALSSTEPNLPAAMAPDQHVPLPHVPPTHTPGLISLQRCQHQIEKGSVWERRPIEGKTVQGADCVEKA
jgi:hypothetical protein